MRGMHVTGLDSYCVEMVKAVPSASSICSICCKHGQSVLGLVHIRRCCSASFVAVYGHEKLRHLDVLLPYAAVPSLVCSFSCEHGGIDVCPRWLFVPPLCAFFVQGVVQERRWRG